MDNVLEKVAQKLNIPIDLLVFEKLDFKITKISQGENLVALEQDCDHIGFVLSGMLRKYRLSSTGKEITTDLIFENGFAAPYSDQILKQKTTQTIQAISTSKVALFKFSQIRSLIAKNIDWAHLILNITEQLYLEKEEKEQLLIIESAEKRLNLLLKRHPNLISTCPKQIIASYLSINPSTLSRILNKKIC